MIYDDVGLFYRHYIGYLGHLLAVGPQRAASERRCAARLPVGLPPTSAGQGSAASSAGL